MRLNLDFLAKGSFQTTPDGQRLFYPNGMAGKGYVVESEEMYQQLFRQQKRWGISIMVLISTLVAAKVGWMVMLPLFIVLNMLKQAAVRQTTRHMQLSTVPYSVDRFFGQALRLPAMHPSVLQAVMSGSALVCLVCVGVILYEPAMWRKALGYASFAGLLFYLGLRQRRGK